MENNAPVKKKRLATNAVAVCLSQQLVMPVFVETMQDRANAELLPVRRIEVDADSETKTKLWLDASLFREALVDLLQDAVRHSDGRQKILFSVSSKGMAYCRIGISYLPKVLSDALGDDRYDIPCNCTSRTREIVSQHRAAISMERDGRNVVIALRFPN